MAEVDLGKVTGDPGIVETRVDGTWGYVKYANGIMEQWGMGAVPVNQSTYELQLGMHYVNDQYNVQLVKHNGKNNNDVESGDTYADKFIVKVRGAVDTNNTPFYWRTIGKYK